MRSSCNSWRWRTTRTDGPTRSRTDAAADGAHRSAHPSRPRALPRNLPRALAGGLTILLVTALAGGCGRDVPDATGQHPPRDTTDRAPGARLPDTGQPVEPSQRVQPPWRDVAVTLREFDIDMPKTLPPGPTAFHLKNAGSQVHGFGIENEAGQRLVFTDDLPSNQTTTLRAELVPGKYRAYCPVGEHAQHGMSRELTVTEKKTGGG